MHTAPKWYEYDDPTFGRVDGRRVLLVGLVLLALMWSAKVLGAGSGTGLPPPYNRDYAEFHARVAAGSPGVLYVGGKVRPTYDDCWVPSGSFGWADGAYDCYRDATGRPMFVPQAKKPLPGEPAGAYRSHLGAKAVGSGSYAPAATTTAAPGVAAPKPFRRGETAPGSHVCANCGRSVTTVTRWNRWGHGHDCPCGNSWDH